MKVGVSTSTVKTVVESCCKASDEHSEPATLPDTPAGRRPHASRTISRAEHVTRATMAAAYPLICGPCLASPPPPLIQPLGACLDCAPRPPEVLQALRYGWAVIDLCRMTMPGHGYNARWAPEGKPMNANDPHLCSPGPDDQVMNLLLHMLLSMFRKPGRAPGRRQERQRA